MASTASVESCKAYLLVCDNLAETRGVTAARPTMPTDANHRHYGTREAALTRLAAFVPQAGPAYQEKRNYDHSPADRSNVSTLSAYLTRRMIREEEVLQAILRHHSLSDADKFVQEVCWRTYWKGWLALRPAIWSDYCDDVASNLQTNQTDPDLGARYRRAIHGESGIDCFDDWACALVRDGYLHNHARMWFASIWIFTLHLPWSLGADFFYRHLLDADPAANTLSWRWVAGLQTRGKPYVARAANINKFTSGRYNPSGQLNEDPSPLTDARVYPAAPLPPLDQPCLRDLALWIVTIDDLHPAYVFPQRRAALGMMFLQPEGRWRESDLVRTFNQSAFADAAAAATERFGDRVVTGPQSISAVVRHALGIGAKQVAVMDAYVGETHQQLTDLELALKQSGIPLVRLRRRWDERCFPFATKGYFHFRGQAIRSIQPLLMEAVADGFSG
jgi:deoxyribodipyrimidine photo-lyase